MEQNSNTPKQNTSAEQAAASAQEQEAPKKKNKKPIIIAAVIAAIALLVGGILLFKHLSDNDSGSRKKDRKKTDSSAMDDEKLDLTDYDFNGEEPTEENIYTDGPEESVATQLGVSYDDNGDFQALGGSFDTEVFSEYDALDFLNEYSDEIGIDDVYDELELLDESTLNDITYYKFQQMLDDVPVYGNQLIVSVNDDGIVNSVIGGYTPVDVDTDPSIDQAKAEDIAKKYAGGEAEILSDELVICPYIDGGSSKLVYDIEVLGSDKYAELFIDADNGDIISENDLLDEAYETLDVNVNGNVYSIDLEKNALTGYNFVDTKRDITVADPGTSSIVGVTVNELTIGRILDGFLPMSADIIRKNDDGTVLLQATPSRQEINLNLNEYAVCSLNSVEKAYDYYNDILGWKSIDGNGMPLKILVGPSYKALPNDFSTLEDVIDFLKLFLPSYADYPGACYIEDTNVIVVGAIDDKPLTGSGILGHEYTHGVVHNTANISNNPQPKTINEGYADTMGAIISGDWLFIKNETPPGYDHLVRSAINPNEYGYPDKVGGEYYIEEPRDEHKNATIVSHSAYLMSQKGLSNEQIARLFFQSLKSLSSNPDFEETAQSILAAAYVLHYTDEEKQAVKEALQSTRMLVTGRLEVNVHCGSHPIPNATVIQNGTVVGTTDENGKLEIKYDPDNVVGNTITVRADGFKDLTAIALTWYDEEKCDCNLAVDKDFGAAHGSDAPISDGSNGEKVKVTIMDMSYDNSDSHSKPKGQDYYVLKGSRISLYKLVDAMKNGMDKVKDKDPELGALMGDISTDGTKIYMDTGYMSVELTYHIYGTDEVFDFSKPITEDVVIEPVVGIGDFGFGDFSFNGEDLNDLADQLDSMFNGGGKK